MGRSISRNRVAAKCSNPHCNAPASFHLDVLLYAGENAEHGPLTIDTKRKVCLRCRHAMRVEDVLDDRTWLEIILPWSRDSRTLMPVRKHSKLGFRALIVVATA